jgi:hypothetical protein
MFIEDLAEPFLNVKSKTLQELLDKFPAIVYQDCSSEGLYLKEEQKKYINAQILLYLRKFEEVQAIVAVEKSRQEDELHEIFKKGGEMTADKKEKYEAICATFEKIRWTGTL